MRYTVDSLKEALEATSNDPCGRPDREVLENITTALALVLNKLELTDGDTSQLTYETRYSLENWGELE